MTSDMDLKAQAAAVPWFHAIDFGDFQSAGRFTNGMQQNATLFGFMDLMCSIDVSGMDCLDIGAQDGLVSFGLKKLGARRVVACDSSELKSFHIARKLLDLDVEYIPGVQLKDFERIFAPGTFDLVVCAGVIYHMLNPMSAFTEVRRVVKHGGLAFFETAYSSKEDRAVMILNSEDEPVNEPNTYWVPSQRAVLGMARLARFNPVAIRYAMYPTRLTVLGRACTPEDIDGRTDLCRQIHELGIVDRTYYGVSSERSSIIFAGEFGPKMWDGRTDGVAWPFHAPNPTNPVGKNRQTGPGHYKRLPGR